MWFYLWILAEIAMFILVGSWIGVGWTLLAIVATTLLGFGLLRTESGQVMQKMHAAVRKGGAPALAGLDSSMVMMAGILLIIPGFISDAFGVLLLVPGVRHVLIRQFKKAGVHSSSGFTRASSKQHQAIDAEFWEDKSQEKVKDDQDKT